MYKIVSKVLASQLKHVIGEVMNEDQSSYIEGKHILEGPLVINEVIAWAKKDQETKLSFQS